MSTKKVRYKIDRTARRAQSGFTEQNIFVVDSLDAAMPILAALNADVTLFENDLPDNYTE